MNAGDLMSMCKQRCAGGLLLAAVLMPLASVGEPLPPLWGYGVRSCDQYAHAWVGAANGVDSDIAEQRRYRDWLSGFISALSLSIGRDVLAGADIEGAMRRNYLYCDEHRKDDFFTATMDYLKTLSVLR